MTEMVEFSVHGTQEDIQKLDEMIGSLRQEALFWRLHSYFVLIVLLAVSIAFWFMS